MPSSEILFYPTEDERLARRDKINRPSQAALRSLSANQIPIGALGDIMADVVHLFHWTARPLPLDPFYKENPPYRQVEKVETKKLKEQLCRDGIPLKQRDKNASEEVGYRLVKAYADRLVEVYCIEYQPDGVTKVRARKVCNHTSVNIEFNTAFDF